MSASDNLSPDQFGGAMPDLEGLDGPLGSYGDVSPAAAGPSGTGASSWGGY